jgi:Rad3-related DNA helicase
MEDKFKIKNLNINEIPFKKFQNPSARNRWDKTQKHIYEEIIQSDKRFVMLSAPTGLGKSLICAMAAYALSNKINYVCSDKQLQHQLLEDFPEAVLLKGRSNYVCNLFPHLNADTCTAKCSDYKTDIIKCNYYDQKTKLLKADFRILNTYYILFEMNYAGQLSGQDLFILDEADSLDLIFINFVSLQVSDRQIQKYGLGYPKKTIVESWIDWAGRAIDILKANYNTDMFKNALDPEFIKAVKLLKKLKLFLSLVEDDWIYNSHSGYSEFKPVWITKALIDNYLFQHADRFILCSASLSPKSIICETLQIDINQCDYIEVGSSFLPENRKVIYDPIMDMSRKYRDNYMDMMDAIESVINLPENLNVKGIIHSQSYDLRNKIMSYICDPRLITHDPKDKAKMLKIFYESEDPLIFVSPSCVRGLSLNDNLCRFGICPKMPFPNLGDKAIQARCYKSGKKGKAWYNSETGQSVLQMSGRHVRSFSDWGVMYILDSCFARVRKSLPCWFDKDIIQDFDY